MWYNYIVKMAATISSVGFVVVVLPVVSFLHVLLEMVLLKFLSFSNTRCG